MEKLSRYVLTNRRRVVAITVLVVLAGEAALALLLPNLSERNEYPGLPAYEANQRIAAEYGTGGYERPYVPVVTVPDGHRVDGLAPAFRSVAAETGSRVVSYVDTRDRRFVSADGRTTFALVFGGPVEQGGMPGSALGEGAGLDAEIERVLRAELPAGATVQVTGLDTLATGKDTGGLNVPVKLAITLAAAAIVLTWAFRSALALVPLLTALIALPAAFAGLWLVSGLITIHETTLMMIPLFGLAIAVDYALILVTRWREERAAGHTGDDAVHRAMAGAGRAVVCSGAVVAIGLTAMIVLPIPLLRSLGVGATVVTICSAAVSLTVLPLVLSATGARWDRRGLTDQRERRASAAWTSWARRVVRHRWLAATASMLTLVALSQVATGINLHVPTTDNLADSGPGRDALTSLERAGIPSGTLTSFDVYVPSGVDPDRVANTLRDVEGVYTVAAPHDWRQDGSALLTILPEHDGGSPAGNATIEQVIDAAPDGVLVGGNVTQQLDYLTAVYTAFPWLLALIALVTLVLVAAAFRSIVLALKAVALNLLSLGAVLGTLVILWQWGWGTEAIFGIAAEGSIGTFVPVTVFAFLFGLTMDYEVFILARIVEEYRRTGSTTEAVVRGVGRTGRLVSCAAVILCCSFGAMAFGGELDVAVFASGVAIGILLDALLIRSVLVPATVAIAGRLNWWQPAARVRA